MKKLYVSCPMKDLTKEEINKTQKHCFEDACLILRDNNLELIDTVNHNLEKNTPLESLADNISKLASADYIYFADGWSTARGCSIEHECCRLYKLNIIRD